MKEPTSTSTAGTRPSALASSSHNSPPWQLQPIALAACSALLISSLVVLPRCPILLNFGDSPRQRSSIDRPEHPFLTPLTAHPLGTMAWHVSGVFLTMLLWARYLSVAPISRSPSTTTPKVSRRPVVDWIVRMSSCTLPDDQRARDALVSTVILSGLSLPGLFALGAPLNG